MKIKGSTFLITGGASGLGAACVMRFAKLGANAVILDMSPKGETMAKEAGPNVRFSLCDITKEEDVAKTVALAKSSFGDIHGVIGCAGIATGEKTIAKDGRPHALATFQKTININLIGAYNVIRLAVAAMVKDPAAKGPQTEDRGVIINTASIAAFEGQIGQCAYSASKGALVAMTLPLAREMAQYGIRAVTISPGIFDTPMLASLDEKVRTALGQMVPFPARLGQPEEYAALAQHICENSMINGEVIRLDGAIRMAAR